MTIEIPTALTESDRAEIEQLLALVGTDDPTLEQIWQCMDAVWDQLGCDNKNIDDDKLSRFYSHPVWLLNGLFIEQHQLSMRNREIISDWIASKSVRRVADLGGGFGNLARMIASKCPGAKVEIVEPFPHILAIRKAAAFGNLTFEKNLTGSYDMIIAVDVFEHVKDPLKLIYETARYLRIGGMCLTANCFYPVIKCHLPCTFHFRRSWKAILRALELLPEEDVCYGSAFRKAGNGSLLTARIVECISRYTFAIAGRSVPVRSRLKLGTRLRNTLARFAH